MVIGITGGIATGKSTFSNYIKSLGYPLIDSDQLAYDCLTIDVSSISQVDTLFHCVENGKVNRQKLAEIVFHDKQKKQQLEAIVHPYVISHIQTAVENSKESFIFLDIPLLYECHLEYLCDRIVVIYINEQLQLSRLIERNHYPLEHAQSRISSQMSIEEKRLKADYVINNEGNLDNFYKQADLFIEHLKKGDIAWLH